MCVCVCERERSWNLFLILLTHVSSSICLEGPKDEAYVNKSITCIKKNKLKSCFKKTIS